MKINEKKFNFYKIKSMESAFDPYFLHTNMGNRDNLYHNTYLILSP